jgi:hypothetical protein
MAPTTQAGTTESEPPSDGDGVESADIVSSLAAGLLSAIATGIIIMLLTGLYAWRLGGDTGASAAKTGTNILLVAGVAAWLGASAAAAYIFPGRFITVCIASFVILVLPGVFGLRILSHINACDAGISYPLSGSWEYSSQRCGR